MSTALEMQPCVGAARGVCLTQASRKKVGVEVGEIVLIEYDGNTIQRAVQTAPLKAVDTEKTADEADRPLCIINPRDWGFLNMRPPASANEFRSLRVAVAKAEHQIEMP